MHPPDQQMILGVLRELGVTPADLHAMNGRPFLEAQAMLATLKETVRKNGKRLLFELHPDRTGNDPVKTERFKQIAAAMNDIDKLTVREVPQAPPPPVVMFVVMRPVVQSRAGTGANWVQTGRPSPPGPQRPSPLHVVTLKPT